MRGARFTKLLLVAWMAQAALIASAADDPRQSYLDGLRAYQRQEWREAARLLRQAIAKRPEELPRARLVGAMPEPYLPQAYLGLALYRLEQCDQAATALAVSLGQHAIEAVPALATEAQTAQAHCVALREAGRFLAEAEVARERLEALLSEEASVERAGSDFPTRQREALDELARARLAMIEAKRQWLPLLAERARGLAEAASSGMSQLVAELRHRQDQERLLSARLHLEQTILDAMSLEQSETDQGAARRALASLAAERSQAQAQLRLDELGGLEAATQQLRLAIDAARRGLERPVAAEVEAAMVQEPEPATPPAAVSAAAPVELPGELRAAMEAYFAGDYSQALVLLEERKPLLHAGEGLGETSRVRLFVALFRAAARYATYLLSGEQDQRMLEAAAADLKVARQLGPAFSPHPDFFSPRFLAFFRDHP